MDHLLVGPGGVWAVEVKVRPVTINVAGDQWTFDKYDRYGNLVGHGALVDRRNRSWGRQVTEVAYELERFIFSRGVLTSVRGWRLDRAGLRQLQPAGGLGLAAEHSGRQV